MKPQPAPLMVNPVHGFSAVVVTSAWQLLNVVNQADQLLNSGSIGAPINTTDKVDHKVLPKSKNISGAPILNFN